jgi:nucleotide-binding universal stress UspA family protein
MFEKILVCLDGSFLAEQILPYISAEASHFSKVILLKVLVAPEMELPLGVPGQPAVPVYTQSRLDRFQKEAVETPVYLEEKAQLLREKGLDVESVIIQGIPRLAIISYARDNGVGLIAIATHGHSGLRQVALGSTAEYILKHAGLPILLVTPHKHGQ